MEPTPAIDILLLAAHGPDLRGFRTALGERLTGTVGSLHITAKTIGIGIAAAGPAATKRLFQLDPRAVLHVGTCGVYPGLSRYQPHDVVVSSRIDLLDLSVTAGTSAFPAPMVTELSPDTTLSAALGRTGDRSRPAPVATPLASTVDEKTACNIPGRSQVHAENLEAFAVAQACHFAHKPFTCVLGVSHMVGTGLGENRVRFERESSQRAAEVVLDWLANGAPGLPDG